MTLVRSLVLFCDNRGCRAELLLVREAANVKYMERVARDSGWSWTGRLSIAENAKCPGCTRQEQQP